MVLSSDAGVATVRLPLVLAAVAFIDVVNVAETRLSFRSRDARICR